MQLIKKKKKNTEHMELVIKFIAWEPEGEMKIRAIHLALANSGFYIEITWNEPITMTT